jgi:hypothetical protein
MTDVAVHGTPGTVANKQKIPRKMFVVYIAKPIAEW